MKRFTSALVVLVVAAAMSVQAQTLSQFRNKLGATSTGGYATVKVVEDASAQRALAELESDKSREKVAGYRVGVFLSNSSNARARANSTVALCDSLYSDVAISMTYDNPYFKVNAGYCLTLEEGVILLNRLQGTFPRAFLLREEIKPRDMVRAWNREKHLHK